MSGHDGGAVRNMLTPPHGGGSVVATDEARRCTNGKATLRCVRERATGRTMCQRCLDLAAAKRRRRRERSGFVERVGKCAKGSVPAEVRAQLADPARLPKRPPGRG